MPELCGSPACKRSSQVMADQCCMANHSTILLFNNVNDHAAVASEARRSVVCARQYDVHSASAWSHDSISGNSERCLLLVEVVDRYGLSSDGGGGSGGNFARL